MGLICVAQDSRKSLKRQAGRQPGRATFALNICTGHTQTTACTLPFQEERRRTPSSSGRQCGSACVRPSIGFLVSRASSKATSGSNSVLSNNGRNFRKQQLCLWGHGVTGTERDSSKRSRLTMRSASVSFLRRSASLGASFAAFRKSCRAFLKFPSAKFASPLL